MREAKRLFWNGMLFSACFAGLEGCVAACVALSSAIVPKGLAATVNATLYLCFALSTFAAPQIVSYFGPRRAMLISMTLYGLYLLAFLLPSPPLIIPAAAVGGIAGAVLWTAQGEYFTLNSLAYAAACGQTASAAENRAISLFAGVFATLFQVCLVLAKPLAAVLLSAQPDRPQLPFVAFLVISAACTAGMTATRSLGSRERRGACNLGGTAVNVAASRPPLATVCAGPSTLSADSSCSRVDGSKYAPSAGRGASSGRQPGPAASTPHLEMPTSAATLLRSQAPSLCAMLLDERMLLLTPTNAAFGMATGLFPAKVTVLVKDALGVADAAWMYSIAGVTAAVLAAVFALMARRFRHGRFAAMVLGACGFGAGSGALLLCDAGNADGGSGSGSGLGSDACPQLRSRRMLLLLFVGYGCGLAAWQGSCMALVAEMHKQTPRAAFAHLKLTSGLVSFHAFLLFPHVSMRIAAGYTFAVVLAGLACLLRLHCVLRARTTDTVSLLADPGARVAPATHEQRPRASVITGGTSVQENVGSPSVNGKTSVVSSTGIGIGSCTDSSVLRSDDGGEIRRRGDEREMMVLAGALPSATTTAATGTLSDAPPPTVTDADQVQLEAVHLQQNGGACVCLPRGAPAPATGVRGDRPLLCGNACGDVAPGLADVV